MNLQTACYAPLMSLFILNGLLAKGPTYVDPSKTDDDYAIQGEYSGSIQTEEELKLGIQLIARGSGNFDAIAYSGGLPGTSDDIEFLERARGTRKDDGRVLFDGSRAKVIYQNGQIFIVADGNSLGTLKKVERQSPTLGKKPPGNAVVLFAGESAGKDVNQWIAGKTESGLLVQGTTSKRRFQSHSLHIEFRLPYMPEATGQDRGNSGIYLQGRYEVQMLDSFGQEGKQQECGGIYSIRDPDINMCFPPLRWQTYDIDFVAAEYDQSGNVVEQPKITVRHNGILIHKNVELPHSTTASPLKPGPDPGPVYLQDHGNPVRYRNIWVVPK